MFARIAMVFGVLSTAVLAQSPVPEGPLAMRDFRLQFDPSGTYTLGGDPGWPPMAGRWTIAGNAITLQNDPGPSKCDGAAKYRFTIAGSTVGLDLISDDCKARVMILDRSRWLPPGSATAAPARNITRTAGTATGPLTRVTPTAGDWPSFRGREATGISEKQNLPDTWNPATGENIRWRTPIPGLAHSSPIVWGDTVFVTSAISSRAGASWRGSDRRAFTPTTSTADCDGRWISAASIWALTTFRPTNGDRPARRSSGTIW